MAARKRSQERDYNRRRWMVLDKGFDRAYNQKDTAFGECLLKWNVREESLLQRRQRILERQGDISLVQREQEKKLFMVTRDQALREPTLLLERTPSAEQYPDFVDLRRPRFMRPLQSRQSKTPEFSTFSVFQAVKKRKRNPWEEAIKETVQFRPTLCPCARLNTQDSEKLLMDWVVVNEKQTKALGLKSDNRSAPIKQVRTGANPLNLPPRLNSRLHHLAQDYLDDLSGDSSAGSSDDDSEAGAEEEVDANDKEDDSGVDETPAAPVFVTQLAAKSPAKTAASEPPKSAQTSQQLLQQLQTPQHQQLHELVLFEARDNSKKDRLLAQKQQLDAALSGIHQMLEQRRVAGRPQIRQAHRQQSEDVASASSEATASSTTMPAGLGFPSGGGHFRTSCRTAESLRILREARRGGSVDGKRQRQPQQREEILLDGAAQQRFR